MDIIEQEYRQSQREIIAEQIECYIIANKLKPHEKLPGERELCDMWKCNRMTLRSAIRRLVMEGKLYSIAGNGTYVAPSKLEKFLLDSNSFSESMERQGKTVTNTLLGMVIHKVSGRAADRLEIPKESFVYVITRLRLVNGEPITIENAYLPVSLFPDLEHRYEDTQSLYQVLKKGYNISISGGEEEISITNATDMEAELLGISEGDPLFYVVGVSKYSDSKPFEYSESVIRTDKVYFSSVLK